MRDQPHPQRVHGFVSVGEGALFYGGVLGPLAGNLDVAEGLGDIPTFPAPTNRGGAITYDMEISTADLALNGGLTASDLALDGRAVVLHGAMVSGAYAAPLPVARGVVERVN